MGKFSIKRTAQFLGYVPRPGARGVVTAASSQVGGLTSSAIDGLRVIVETANLTDSELRLIHTIRNAKNTESYEVNFLDAAELIRRGFVRVQFSLTDDGLQLVRESRKP